MSSEPSEDVATLVSPQMILVNSLPVGSRPSVPQRPLALASQLAINSYGLIRV